MTARESLALIERRNRVLNRRETSIGLPPLHEGDAHWPAIVREMQKRLGFVALQTVRDGRPSMLSLETVGAWVVAAMMMLDQVEQADPATGEELAA